jgi:rubrerythrin
MNNYDEDEEKCLTNRDKKLAPKLGIYWCRGCDFYLVRSHKPCPNCKYINGKKRFKAKRG